LGGTTKFGKGEVGKGLLELIKNQKGKKEEEKKRLQGKREGRI